LTLTMFSSKKPWTVAEERIKQFINLYQPKWLYVMFSGGRDSAAVLAAARSVTSDIVAVYLHIAGQTHRDNVVAAIEAAKRLDIDVVNLGVARRGSLRHKVMKAVEEHGTPVMLHIITVDYQRHVDYWTALKIYGFPAPRERWGGGKRWCCAHFKSDWMAELPPNASVNGRPVRALLVGIRREESNYRKKLWSDVGKLPLRIFKARDGLDDYALAPILDMTTAEVDEMLRHYGIANIILRQYERWRRAPNCMLCPLMGKAECRLALQNMPTTYLQRVKQVLEELLPRYKDGTFSKNKIREWIEMIDEELARRADNT